jgi:hypothetical protein
VLRQQREAKIEQDNKKLVVNMMQIVAKMGKEAAQVAAPFKIQSRAEAQRRRQAQEIARQNYVCVQYIYEYLFVFLVASSPLIMSSFIFLLLFIKLFTPHYSLDSILHLYLSFREQTLAMRIINQKPSFDQKKLETDFKKHEQIVRFRILRNF